MYILYVVNVKDNLFIWKSMKQVFVSSFSKKQVTDQAQLQTFILFFRDNYNMLLISQLESFLPRPQALCA